MYVSCMYVCMYVCVKFKIDRLARKFSYDNVAASNMVRGSSK